MAAAAGPLNPKGVKVFAVAALDVLDGKEVSNEVDESVFEMVKLTGTVEVELAIVEKLEMTD